MEVKFQVRHHDLDDLLCVCGESVLEFAGVTHEHLTRRGLLLEARRTDTETRRVSQRDKLPVRVVLHHLHVFICTRVEGERYQGMCVDV